MAKTLTEAKSKKATKKNPLLPEDDQFERKLMDEPEDDFDGQKEIDPKKENFNGQLKKSAKTKIEITKGKLLKGDRVEVDYLKTEGTDSKPAECSEKHTDPPRKEFKNAFAALSVHAALIGEFIPLTSINDISQPDPETIKDFTVTGFTIHAPGDDDEGVIITAHKSLKSGKAMGFNTPLIRFNDASDSAYPYLDELAVYIDSCKHEIREYLNGKHAEDPQIKLDL